MGIHCLISSNGLCISPPVGLANAMETWLSIWVCHGGGEKTTPGNKKRQLASSSPMRLVWLQTHYIHWLVVYLPLWKIWKSIDVNWDDDIPNLWKVIKAMFQSPPSRYIWTHQVVMLWHSPPCCPGEPNHQEEQQAQGQERTESHHGEEGAAWKVGTGGSTNGLRGWEGPGKAGKQKSEKARIHRISSSTPYETYDRCTQSFEIIISSRNINNMK